MTWKDIKLATLQKMFSAEGTSINQNDEGVKEYINAMPQAANEAMQLLCTAGKYLRKSYELEKTAGQGMTVDLKTELPDFYSPGLFELYLQDGAGGLAPLYGARLLGGRYLALPPEAGGTILFFYNAWPPLLTLTTEENMELPLDPEVAVLLPLYMASQLYKDDDISIATSYRNEFEAARELLVSADMGAVGGEFTSVTGWC